MRRYLDPNQVLSRERVLIRNRLPEPTRIPVKRVAALWVFRLPMVAERTEMIPETEKTERKTQREMCPNIRQIIRHLVRLP